MRYPLSAFVFGSFLLLLAGTGWGQNADRATHARRLAEVEREIEDLNARLRNLFAEKTKLHAALQPNFKDAYRKSPDAKALQGTWQPTHMVWSYFDIAPESVANLKLVIDKDWFLPSRGPIKWVQDGIPGEGMTLDMEGAWKIDPTTDPKSIVIHPRMEDNRSLLLRTDFRGIYKLEGDTLTVCFGELATPPAGFDDKKAFLRAVYKRVSDAKKPGN